jgi:hypothetical protein
MNDLSDIGLSKREFRDVHSVVSRLDHQVRRLVEPQPLRRPAGLGQPRLLLPLGPPQKLR